MRTLIGKYNQADVFTNNIDDTTSNQVIELCNQDWVKGSIIKIMSDCHAGKGCVIGTTMTIADKISPSLVGVDLGCGMLCIDITGLTIELDKLDAFIHRNIPSGHNNNDIKLTNYDNYKNLLCYGHLKNKDNFGKAIGSLGGGNHFIEINKSDLRKQYLVIHSGSRNLGKQVAEYYQNIAIDSCKNDGIGRVEQRQLIIDGLRSIKKEYEISMALQEFDKQFKEASPQYPRELCYVSGHYMDDYLHDMKIAQEYASINRITMAQTILGFLGSDITEVDNFETIHNYINFEDNIMRKGAVSAKLGEKLIIPINMKDGSLLCIGKGNDYWNQSAPHGAGRLMSRHEAKRTISMDDYKSSMTDVYTSCVTEETLDESPMAYKPMEEIIANIQDTVEIVDIIKPMYNFKASE